MRKWTIGHPWRRALSAVVLGVCVGSLNCRHAASTPPPGVPPDAVPVAFSKDGGWAYCWLDPEINLDRCRTYNASGVMLWRIGHEDMRDDVYLRYRGEGPVPESDLEIDSRRTDDQVIWLKNGVILLPRDDYEFQKAALTRRLSAAGEPDRK